MGCGDPCSVALGWALVILGKGAGVIPGAVTRG